MEKERTKDSIFKFELHFDTLMIVLIFLMVLFLYLQPFGATGYVTYTGNSVTCGYNVSNPAYPDWNISESLDCTASDGTIELAGSVLVYGNLKLDNITLIFNTTADGQYNITVYNGGVFNITSGSNITTNNTSSEFIFTVNSGSTFQMFDSYLSECGYSSTYPGLSIKTNNTIIHNNTILNSAYYGIFLSGVYDSTITNNTIYNISQDLVYLNFSVNTTASNNTLTAAISKDAFYLDYSNDSLFQNNNVIFTDQIYMKNSSGNTFSNNTVYGNGFVVYLDGGGSNILSNNSYTGPGTQAQFLLDDSHNNILDYNYFYGTTFYFTNPSHNNTLRYNNYTSGNQGFNIEGVNNTFLNNTIRSTSQQGFYIVNADNLTLINNTIISPGTTNSAVEIADSWDINITGNIIKDSRYGLEIDNTSNAVIKDNIIYNISQYGIAPVGSDENITIDNNTFYDITAYAAIACWYDFQNTNITNNRFYNISGDEGVLSLLGCSNATFSGNTIYNNDNDYAIYLDNTATSNVVTNNTIENNSNYGIYLDGPSSNNITNNTICYNGQGVYNSTSTNIVDNNTFCNNLLTPAHGSSPTSLTSFTFNVSNPLFTTSCQLYLDGSQVASNSSVYNHNTSTIPYTTFITVGSHNWFVYCNDSLSTNWANSSLFIFTKQTVCGDGYCEAGELCSTCFADCGSCASVGGGVLPPAEPEETEPEVNPTEQPLEIIPIPEPGTVIDIPSGGVSVSLEPNVFLNLYGATATVHNITKVEGGRYKILVCDQAELVSYEINVTVDLAYFCINYSEYTGVTDLSIFKFEDDWLELGTRNIVIGDQVICGNISSTPYMIAGFSRPATAALALESIQLANQSVSEALERGANAFDSLDLLKKANNAYFNCKYEEATGFATSARESIAEVEPEILFFILIGVMLILAGIWYYWSRVRRRVKVKVKEELTENIPKISKTKKKKK